MNVKTKYNILVGWIASLPGDNPANTSSGGGM